MNTLEARYENHFRETLKQAYKVKNFKHLVNNSPQDIATHDHNVHTLIYMINELDIRDKKIVNDLLSL